MLGSVELKDYMDTNPAKVNINDSVFKAIEWIIEKKLSGVCVVDGDGKLVGVLSEIDCLRAALGNTYNKGGFGLVSEYMTPMENVVFADINDDVVDIASDMLKKNHRRRPVLDNGKLIGQITCRRLLIAVRDFTEEKSRSA